MAKTPNPVFNVKAVVSEGECLTGLLCVVSRR